MSECPRCARLLHEIELLKDALIVKHGMRAGSFADEGEEFRVIKVRKIKGSTGFSVVEDESGKLQQ